MSFFRCVLFFELVLLGSSASFAPVSICFLTHHGFLHFGSSDIFWRCFNSRRSHEVFALLNSFALDILVQVLLQ
jgi:hypothetical protein